MEQVRISFAGNVSPERLDLKGKLEPFDMNSLPFAALSYFKGMTDGALTLTGTMKDPELEAECEVLGFSSTQEMIGELPELDFRVSVSLADGLLQTSTVISNAAAGRIAASFRMPLACSLDPLIFRPDTSGIKAELEADMVLGILNRLSVFKDQRLSGKLDVDLRYDRELSGDVRIEKGMYEHYGWGLVVRDLDLNLTAGGGELRVVAATATDGGRGRIELTGGMHPEKLDFLLELHRAGILRRDDLEGSFSGRLGIAGTLVRPKVTGQLTVNRADILIDNITPALPPLLTDFDKTVKTNAVRKVKKGPVLPFDMDIEVDLADQVFANASMIDSVWGGNLRVRGDRTAPRQCLLHRQAVYVHGGTDCHGGRVSADANNKPADVGIYPP